MTESATSVAAATLSSDVAGHREPVELAKFAFSAHFPEALAKAEYDLVQKRRHALGFKNCEAELGVACSGGGIRSATVCLGVFQGLARLGLLKHVDYLSTVSGGGYFGSFFGSLFVPRNKLDPPPTAQRVQDSARLALTDPASSVVTHLRENGRYLAPSGVADYVTALAMYLRNWVAVHWVIGLTLLTFYLGLYWVRSLVWQHVPAWGQLEGGLVELAKARYVWLSPWALLPTAVFVLAVAPLAVAYWLTQWGAAKGDASIWAKTSVGSAARLYRNWPLFAALLICITSVVTLWWRGDLGSPFANLDVAKFALELAVLVSLLAIICWTWAEVLAKMLDPNADLFNLQAFSRNLLTTGLARALQVLGATLLLATVDSLGQTIYAVAVHGVSALRIGLSATGIGILYVAAHKLAPMLTKPDKAKSGWIRVPVQWLALGGGLISLLVVLLVWNVIGNVWTWRAQPPNGDPGYEIVKAIDEATPSASVARNGSLFVYPQTPNKSKYDSPERGMAADWLLGGFLLLLGLNLLTGRSLTLINLSSLQHFYGARLRRAYLGAANVDRTGYVPGTVPIVPPDQGASIGRVKTSDDIAWANYRPENLGGPLHLVNVTVNETIDAASRIETQDRKGFNFAVGPIGASARRDHSQWENGGLVAITTTKNGSGLFEPSSPGKPLLVEDCSVSRWIAVSGAAASTGSGARTSLGLSLLLGLANVRLGYWWNSARSSRAFASLVGRVWHSLFQMQIYLCNECFARFHGPTRAHWFLSDGGHFENTGAYELIRRRLPFILLLDNGQDAQYEFTDVANLVRKVRIDFGVEIEFIEDSDLGGMGGDELLEIVGPLRELRGPLDDNASPGARTLAQRHASLARVKYPDTKVIGVLLVLKPSLTGDEPEDVQEYSSAHPAFPQESTAEQFFDEAQWESYRRLGQHICESVLGNTVWQSLNLLKA